MLRGVLSHLAASYGTPAGLLTRDRVAELLGCSQRTVARLVERGELSTVRIGRLVRFRPVDVDALIDAAYAPLDEGRAQLAPGPKDASGRQMDPRCEAGGAHT